MKCVTDVSGCWESVPEKSGFLEASMLLLFAILFSGCQSGTPENATSEPSDTLRVLAYNIHHGEGMDEVIDLERIADLINEVNPDLVALQEIDSVVTRTKGVDQAAEIGRLTNMQPVFGRFMAYQGGAYGMAVLSRLPFLESTNVHLPDGDEPRSVVSAVIDLPSGNTLRLNGIHFYRTEQERYAQATALEHWLIDQEPMPTMLAGDFNSYRGDSVLTHLEQTWHVVDKGEDMNTFPSWEPDREIDYFMWTPADAFTILHQELLDEPVISDHRPLLIDIVVTSTEDTP